MEKIVFEELTAREKLVLTIILKVNSDNALANKKVEPVSYEYLQEMMKFLEEKGVLEKELIS